MNKLLVSVGICHGLPVSEYPAINGEYCVTFADGTYMLVNAEIVRKAAPNGKPFVDETSR